jgi:hypothetical protein
MFNKSKKKELLTKLFSSFQTGIRSSKAVKPKEYLKTIDLDYESLHLGFNSGQFHHRKDEEFKKNYEQLGILTLNPTIGVNQEDRTPYTCFGTYGIIYPLKDASGDIANLYADRFKLETPKREFLNKEGIYPNHPNTNIKKLYILEDVISTATLIQAQVLKNEEAVISLFDGEITEEMERLLDEFKQLQQIVLISSESNPESAELIRKQLTSTELRVLTLPDAHTFNDMWVNYQQEGVLDFINGQVDNIELSEEQRLKKLEIVSPQKIVFKGQSAKYEVLGTLTMDLGSLNVSIKTVDYLTQKRLRGKINLHNIDDIQEMANKWDRTFGNANVIETDLIELGDLLDLYREQIFEQENSSFLDTSSKYELTPEAQREAMEFLLKPRLIENINSLIETTGIIGEEQSRILSFVIASSYKMPYRLHGLIQASSGKGKSHIINNIADLMPQEDVINFSRITSRSLYNYQLDELMYKLIVIQDENGLDEESLFALRELQSAGYLISSTSSKNSLGKHQARVTKVNAHFSSLMASTKSEVYFDNESRSVILGIDESEEQTERIIKYDNEVRAGIHAKKDKSQAQIILRNVMRVLKSKEVVNPFAHKILLPVEAKMRRRLNKQFQDVIAQITLLHQYQREEDEQGRLISTSQDIAHGIDIFFSAIMFKIDELDSSTRQLYNRILEEFKSQKYFTRKEVRKRLQLKNTKSNILLSHLVDMEYLTRKGSANQGFKYALVNAQDGLEKTKRLIKQELHNQLKQVQEK